MSGCLENKICKKPTYWNILALQRTRRVQADNGKWWTCRTVVTKGSASTPSAYPTQRQNGFLTIWHGWKILEDFSVEPSGGGSFSAKTCSNGQRRLSRNVRRLIFTTLNRLFTLGRWYLSGVVILCNTKKTTQTRHSVRLQHHHELQRLITAALSNHSILKHYLDLLHDLLSLWYWQTLAPPLWRQQQK